MKRTLLLFGIHPAGRVASGVTFLALGAANALLLADLVGPLEVFLEFDAPNSAPLIAWR